MKRRGAFFPAALAWLLCAVPLRPSAAPASAFQDAPAGEARRIADTLARSADVAERRELARALAELGGAGASAALAVLGAAEAGAESAPPGRAAAAGLVRALGGDAEIEPALSLCRDRDALVRREILGFLARGDLAPASLAARAAALEEAALADPDADVRRECLVALGALGAEPAAAALARLVDEVAGSDLAALGEALCVTPAGRAAILGLYQRPLGTQRLGDPELAAALLPGYGRALAEADGGGLAAAEREVLLAALAAPDPAVAAGARAGLERLISRLYAAGDDQRAESVLAALRAEGWNDADALFQAAWFALARSSHPSAALAPARELQTRAGGARGSAERLGGALGCYLEAGAALAGGAPRAALEPLARAAALLDGLIAERSELRPSFDPLPVASPASAAWEEAGVEALRLRALVEVLAAMALLADGADSRDLAVAARARAAHVFALTAQLRAVETGAEMAVSSFDALLDLDLAPRAMLLAGGELPELPRERGIELEAELAAALAAVAPREFPGIAPAVAPATAAEERLALLPAAFGDPLLDPERRALLEALQRARLYSAELALARLEALPDEERIRRESELWRARAARAALYDELERAADLDLLRQRIPSAAALALASGLRDEGRPLEALELATRAHAELESDAAWQGYLWRDWMLARGLMARAGAATDADRADEAEQLLTEALARIEALENDIAVARQQVGPEEARARADEVETLRRLRSSALTALAVNANVKQGDPARATAWFEQAYAIDDGDFMKVLLACYRARAGRAAEARALLRAVFPAPELYYNLACTHALLGERELALAFLARELDENARSRGQRERQSAWARGDPDLASLRGDARFAELLGD